MGTITRVGLIDEESGEWLTWKDYSGDYIVKVIHKNSVKANELRKRRQMDCCDLHKDERYLKFYPARWRDYLNRKDVSDGEVRMMVACLMKCHKHGGAELSYLNNVPINTNSLIAEAGMTRQAAFRAISKLIEHGILAKEKIGRDYRYFLNPWLVVSGTGVEPEFKTRFAGTEWGKEREGSDNA